jgi:hypothetical protein
MRRLFFVALLLVELTSPVATVPGTGIIQAGALTSKVGGNHRPAPRAVGA